jgi:glutamate synthase domain-containing protein 2
MQNINDLIDPDRFKQPNEVSCIKEYVSDKFGFTPQIDIKPSQIRINVPDGATAGSLRPQLHKISTVCQTKRKIIIQIKQN